jgi:hypothetical protein
MLGENAFEREEDDEYENERLLRALGNIDVHLNCSGRILDFAKRLL